MPKTLICDPVLFQKDLSDRVYIVTGANSGAGFATTKQLVSQGAHVVGGCRRVDAGKEAFAEFAGARGSAEVIELNLASLASVRRFAEAFLAKYDRLDGLVGRYSDDLEAGVARPRADDGDAAIALHAPDDRFGDATTIGRDAGRVEATHGHAGQPERGSRMWPYRRP